VSKHLERDLDELKRDILAMGDMVEAMVRRAIALLDERDAEKAHAVIAKDAETDEWEVHVEEECLKILALHQPVAADLRFIAGVLKINSDLERMGDLAVNIAEHAAFLAERPPLPLPGELDAMTDAAAKMVRESLDAFVNLDAAAARKVLPQDERVDQLNRDAIAIILEGMRSDPGAAERLLRLFSVARHLERIADHATNIAEDVVYMVEGEIIRHQHD
jgi:phosphate transport system protein